MKIGDEVICIDNNRYQQITIGKVYTVENKTPSFIFVHNNEHVKHSYPSRLFRLNSNELLCEKIGVI